MEPRRARHTFFHNLHTDVGGKRAGGARARPCGAGAAVVTSGAHVACVGRQRRRKHCATGAVKPSVAQAGRRPHGGVGAEAAGRAHPTLSNVAQAGSIAERANGARQRLVGPFRAVRAGAAQHGLFGGQARAVVPRQALPALRLCRFGGERARVARDGRRVAAGGVVPGGGFVLRGRRAAAVTVVPGEARARGPGLRRGGAVKPGGARQAVVGGGLARRVQKRADGARRRLPRPDGAVAAGRAHAAVLHIGRQERRTRERRRRRKGAQDAKIPRVAQPGGRREARRVAVPAR